MKMFAIIPLRVGLRTTTCVVLGMLMIGTHTARAEEPLIWVRAGVNRRIQAAETVRLMREAGLPVSQSVTSIRNEIIVEIPSAPGFPNVDRFRSFENLSYSPQAFASEALSRYRRRIPAGPVPAAPLPPAGLQAPAAQQGGAGNSLDRPFDIKEQSLKGLAAAIFQFGIILCIIAAAVYIAIGSFYYFAAAGNAALAARGKEIIQRSITGLLLALIAWVLLNTISPQFTELRDPQFRVRGQ